ncbi:acyl-homoserine-lactone synthase [Vibrio diabolicus]|uniref:acyl-homoserine-lactone synthase n=1 Tax=Vibrio diabolicus TaxID=50719 RepID=UPI0021600A38|nr:acyl-homoserine-lactone synthase [Vibrio diabolicus]MCR9567629.1 acyl-homoserine-lactone synthase [Vibrio alginolyticus]MCS0340271.1 acyl-homoserine-lactone synthase [Vibrio diabolicus]
MSLKLSLEPLASTDLPIESKKQALVDTVLLTLTPQERSSLFQQVALYRIKLLKSLFPKYASKSLSVLFELIDYRDLVQQYPTPFSEEALLIEQIAADCYPHWMVFWCECEIAAIKQKSLLNDQSKNQLELPLKDEVYYGVVIDKIEESQLMVCTPNHPHIMTISDAVALTNLELFIKGNKWFEMLPLLSMSQTGKHFLLLKRSGFEKTKVLVSSMLIQDWETRDSWLSYTPQFSNSKWNYCFPNSAFSNLKRLGIIESTSSSKIQSIEEFDNIVKTALINKHKVCEILRLAVTGNTRQKLYYIYLTQKKLTQLLHELGYKISFTVIDQPFILDFYSNIKEEGYYNLGFCDLNNDHILTYRGLWNINILKDEFNKISFFDYIRLVKKVKG